MAPRVSVIIPAFNACASLAETLDSVIAQTYEAWEVIVADDGSSDGTADLAANYHPRVSCVRSQHNLGIGGARNLALAQASGELVALLDADDLWRPEYLERQLARHDDAVAAGENVGITCCDAILLGRGGARERVFTSSPITLTALLRHNTIFVSAIVTRSVIDQLGGFATNCLGTEDYDLWLRILESGRTVLVVNEPLAFYRIGDTTVSSNAAGMARAMQTTYRRALERGRLDAHQRAIVHRELRLQRFIEFREQVARRRAQTGRLPLAMVARAAPLGVRVLVERPSTWLIGARRLPAFLRGRAVAGARRSSV
jgi:glycosyltransferase involved in cell wall biosynthesis